MLPTSDDPDRFAAGASFLTASGRELVVASVAPYRERGLVIHFEGSRNRADAEQLRGELLTIDPAERRDLDDGEFWEEDLVGLTAVDPAGEILGTVTEVQFGPGQDRLVVTTADAVAVLVPFVSDFVADPVDGRIVIDAPAGLFPA